MEQSQSKQAGKNENGTKGACNEEHNRDLISIWYTNTDTLTKEKVYELGEEIRSDTPPDIIAITELKPKNYKRELRMIDYELEGYSFEENNIDDKGPTRGVALYIRKPSDYLRLETGKVSGSDEQPPNEVLSVELSL